MPRKSAAATAAAAPQKKSLLDDGDDTPLLESGDFTVNAAFAQRFQARAEALRALCTALTSLFSPTAQQGARGAAPPPSEARRRRGSQADCSQPRPRQARLVRSLCALSALTALPATRTTAPTKTRTTPAATRRSTHKRRRAACAVVGSCLRGSALLQLAVDDKFLETMLKIRRRDPSIYAACAASAEPEPEPEPEPEAAPRARRTAAPLRLREVQARQLLSRAAAEGELGSESEEAAAAEPPAGPSYAEEAAAARAAFLREAEAALGGGDAAPLRKKSREQATAPAAGAQSELLRRVFDTPAPAADAAVDTFLRDYLTHRKWLTEGADAAEARAGEDSESELEKGEQFEARYNFRFEEPGGGVLAAQPRQPEGLIRKKSSARSDARKAKAERCVACAISLPSFLCSDVDLAAWLRRRLRCARS